MLSHNSYRISYCFSEGVMLFYSLDSVREIFNFERC